MYPNIPASTVHERKGIIYQAQKGSDLPVAGDTILTSDPRTLKGTVRRIVEDGIGRPGGKLSVPGPHTSTTGIG